MDDAGADVGIEEEPALFVDLGRPEPGLAPDVADDLGALRRAGRRQPPDIGCRLELDVDPLRPVLEVPGTGVVVMVVAADELGSFRAGCGCP